MKNIKIYLAFVAGVVACIFLFNAISCTREDAVVGQIDPPSYQYGDAEVKSSQGWNFDKAHSNVMWETSYLGVAALLTGRFNTFSTTVEFEENHPEHITFSGFVVLSTVNTGEPGRDGGCLLSTFGTTTISDTARLVSKQIVADGTGGYDATVELNFHGVKKDLPMKMNFSGISHIDATSPYSVAGISGQFEFLAKTDFGIVSNNIADRVTIRMNMTFKKPD